MVNDHSGADGHNMRGAVAQLRGEELSEIVAELREAAGATARDPVVLDGQEGSVLAENPIIVKYRHDPPDPIKLQNRARGSVRSGGFGLPAWSAADRALPLWLGRKFDVYGHVVVPLRRMPNENLLVVGGLAPQRLAMIANGLAGLRAMIDVTSLRVEFVDGLKEGMPGAGILRAGLDVLAAVGACVRIFPAEEAGKVLAELATQVRLLNGTSDGTSVLLVLDSPEYCSDLHSGSNPISMPGPAP